MCVWMGCPKMCMFFSEALGPRRERLLARYWRCGPRFGLVLAGAECRAAEAIILLPLSNSPAVPSSSSITLVGTLSSRAPLQLRPSRRGGCSVTGVRRPRHGSSSSALAPCLCSAAFAFSCLARSIWSHVACVAPRQDTRTNPRRPSCPAVLPCPASFGAQVRHTSSSDQQRRPVVVSKGGVSESRGGRHVERGAHQVFDEPGPDVVHPAMDPVHDKREQGYKEESAERQHSERRLEKVRLFTAVRR